MNSAELIAQLIGQGYSYSTIGKGLGRDRSLIRQVAVGSKPGRNLTEALGQLTRGASTAEPPRRVASSGELARVRGGAPRATSTSTRASSYADIARRTHLPSGGTMAPGYYGRGSSIDDDEDRAWRLAGWSAYDFGHGEGYHDVEHGAAPPTRGDARYGTVYIEGKGYKQFTLYETDDYWLIDAIGELLELYG